MDERKDYYKILGVSDEEKKLKGSEFESVIKKKFRKIALESHPDRQNGKSEEEKKKAEERFKDASEAYEVLSNEKKREEYDNPTSNFVFNGSGFDAMDIDAFFRGFGNPFNDFGDLFGNRGEPKVKKGDGIRIKIALTLEEILNGCKKKIKYKRREVCPNCNGSGLTENSKKKTCKTCGGTGTIYSSNGFMSMHQTCPTCGGKGHIIENPCSKCNGHGLVVNDFETEITIEKGVVVGTEVIFPNLGNAAPHGNGANGDLHVVIYEKPNNKFERRGIDLYFELQVKVLDAMLGCEVKLDTIDDKKLTVKIPQGTCDGDNLRFKGYGLPLYKSDVRGNMIAIVKLIMPNKLNDKEKELLNELKKQENFK